MAVTDDQRCCTCRHWRIVRDDAYIESEKRGRGVCALTHVFQMPPVNGPYHPESLALAFDHEGYEAELWTSPDFGCVQWASREGRT